VEVGIQEEEGLKRSIASKIAAAWAGPQQQRRRARGDKGVMELPKP